MHIALETMQNLAGRSDGAKGMKEHRVNCGDQFEWQDVADVTLFVARPLCHSGTGLVVANSERYLAEKASLTLKGEIVRGTFYAVQSIALVEMNYEDLQKHIADSRAFRTLFFAATSQRILDCQTSQTGAGKFISPHPIQ